MIKLDHPLLDNEQFEKLRHLDRPGFKGATLSLLFPATDGTAGLEKALTALFAAADMAIESGSIYTGSIRPGSGSRDMRRSLRCWLFQASIII